jgi:two-component SAPR family response regulator
MVEDFFDELHRDVFYEISAFASEADFLKFFSEKGADVCFLDISTPANEDAGLEAAKKMRAADPLGRAHVVFVTSRADKLSKSLELFIRPTDYLLKPVSRAQVHRVLSHILEEERSSVLRVALRFGKNVYFADYSDICSIEKVGRNQRVVESIHKT